MYIYIYIYTYIYIYIYIYRVNPLVPDDNFTPTKYLPPPAAGPQRLTPARKHNYNKTRGVGSHVLEIVV